MPPHFHAPPQLGLWKALDLSACFTGKVRMHVWVVVVANFVAGDTAHLTGDAGQVDFDQPEQVSVERGLIPIV